jgi:hypothetical protein
MHANIVTASLLAMVSAINRATERGVLPARVASVRTGT